MFTWRIIRTNHDEIAPPPTPRRYWTRKAIAQWLVERLSEPSLTLVGIDHGFSFPLRYFEKYGVPHEWTAFLNDFQEHWPTDEKNTYVDFVREGECGNGAARCGDSRWRRITEVRAGAKSVFHFDVPGSVAKSTHAGIPWLRYLRNRVGDRTHFWPFDGWMVPPGKSAVVEVYPALWSHSFPRDGRDSRPAGRLCRRGMAAPKRPGRQPGTIFHSKPDGTGKKSG